MLDASSLIKLDISPCLIKVEACSMIKLFTGTSLTLIKPDIMFYQVRSCLISTSIHYMIARQPLIQHVTSTWYQAQCWPAQRWSSMISVLINLSVFIRVVANEREAFQTLWRRLHRASTWLLPRWMQVDFTTSTLCRRRQSNIHQFVFPTFFNV